MLRFLDIILLVFHTALVLFNLLGWIWPPTRKLHLRVLGITLFAWIGIGLYVGTIGYCPLTDWHWDIKRELGENDLPSSFIKYLIDHLLDIDSDRDFVDIITGLGLAAAILISVYVNFFKKSTNEQRL